jgi:hypothetical protein
MLDSLGSRRHFLGPGGCGLSRSGTEVKDRLLSLGHSHDAEMPMTNARGSPVGKVGTCLQYIHTLKAGEETRCIFVPEAWEVGITTLPAPGTGSSLSLCFLGELQPTLESFAAVSQ